MEEKSGNYLYILFTFIGLALIAIGVFYYVTDEKIELNDEVFDEQKTNTKKTGKIVKSSDIEELSYELGSTINLNGKTLTLDIESKGVNISFEVNNKSVALTSVNGTFDLYTIYGKYLLIAANNKETIHNHYYIVNSDGKVIKDIYEMSNGTYTDSFLEDKFDTSIFIDNNKNIKYNGEIISICSVDDISKSGFSLDTIVSSTYNLLFYEDDAFGIELINGTESSLIEVQSFTCNN